MRTRKKQQSGHEQRLVPTDDETVGGGRTGVSRRHVLIGGIAAATLTGVSDVARPLPAATAAEVDRPSIRGLFTTTRTFDVSFASAATAGLVRGLTLGSLKPGEVNALRIAFDARLQSWTGEPVTCWSNGRSTALDCSLITTGNEATLSLQLPASVAGTAQIALPLRDISLYPAENIAPTVVPTVTLFSDETRVLDSYGTDVATTSVIGAAWGAELSCGWGRSDSVQGQGGSAYAYPRAVQVHSVGPGAVPPGTVLRVVVDPRIARPVELTSAGLDNGQESFASTFEADAQDSTAWLIRTLEPTPAGATATFEIRYDEAAAPSIQDLTYARVTLDRGPNGALQRQTGKDSAEAVSASGLPLIPNGVRGKR